jgi:hypothetical protein
MFVVAAVVFGHVARAAPITWGAAQVAGGASDIKVTGGAVRYAFNGGDTAPGVHDNTLTFDPIVVSGISFEHANFVDLPAGITFAATGSDSGDSPQEGLLNDVYGGNSMTSTGNAHYDELLRSLTYARGTPSGIKSGEMTFSGLIDGMNYQFQVWFNDQRDGQDDRTMIFGDGLGNTVAIDGGDPASGVQVDAHGRFAIGTFTASGSTQVLSMETDGFGNLHVNAVLLQAVPEPTSGALLIIAALALGARRRR